MCFICIYIYRSAEYDDTLDSVFFVFHTYTHQHSHAHTFAVNTS